MKNNYLIEGKKEGERLNFQNKMDICNPDEELAYYHWSKDHQVLDAGCGNGNMIEKLLGLKIKKIDGIDFSPDRVNEASTRFKDYNEVRLFQGTLESTGLQESFYDTILCRYVYEHVANPAVILTELRRLLKPAGSIHIINFDDMVFNFHTKNEKFNLELKKIKSRIPQDLEIGRKLPQLLKQNGFDQVKWSAQTYFFQGERLALEVNNSRMRFEQGRENLSRYFDSLEAYDNFVSQYLSELTDENNVLSSSKFMIQAKKAA